MRVQTKIQMHVCKARSNYEISIYISLNQSKRPRIHELHKRLVKITIKHRTKRSINNFYFMRKKKVSPGSNTLDI